MTKKHNNGTPPTPEDAINTEKKKKKQDYKTQQPAEFMDDTGPTLTQGDLADKDSDKEETKWERSSKRGKNVDEESAED